MWAPSCCRSGRPASAPRATPRQTSARDLLAVFAPLFMAAVFGLLRDAIGKVESELNDAVIKGAKPGAAVPPVRSGSRGMLP